MKRRTLLVWIGLLVFSGGVVAEAAGKHSAVTPVPREDDWWVKRHESFNARAEQGDVDLVFIGDSITHSWENAGKEVWKKYYGHRKAMNLGISGDRTQHVLWRFENGEVEGGWGLLFGPRHVWCRRGIDGFWNVVLDAPNWD